MKIGVITFHAAENFGSALQAFALCTILKRLGNEPELIDYRYTNDQKQYNCFRTHLYKKRPKAILGDILYFPFNFKRKCGFRNFRHNFFKETKIRYYDDDNLNDLNYQFDCFVCGSDQIWNINCLGSIVEPYFLGFASEDKKKIAYAPSMPSDISIEFYDDIKHLIDSLDYISVRESKTKELLKNKLGIDRKISVVLDPTLLLSAGDYVKIFDLKKTNGEYLFLYILGHDSQNTLIVDEAIRVANKHRLKIKYVYIRRIKKLIEAEYCLGIDPLGFLKLIYNARFVVTNSFHATVFSLLFGQIFLTFGRKGSESRALELLENVGVENHYFISNGNLWDEDQYDKIAVGDKLSAKADESIMFLKEALQTS